MIFLLILRALNLNLNFEFLIYRYQLLDWDIKIAGGGMFF